MTYKSFDTILEQRLEARDLVRFVPLSFDPDESEIRELFMPRALQITLFQDNPTRARDYAANMRAFLARYVKGQSIDNDEYMKNWKEDVWELRVQNQRRKERIRIFGAFGRPDTFVALFRKPRQYFKGIGDSRWDEQIYRVVNEWERLFPGCKRLVARPFSNCVTANFYDVYDGD